MRLILASFTFCITTTLVFAGDQLSILVEEPLQPLSLKNITLPAPQPVQLTPWNKAATSQPLFAKGTLDKKKWDELRKKEFSEIEKKFGDSTAVNADYNQRLKSYYNRPVQLPTSKKKVAKFDAQKLSQEVDKVRSSICETLFDSTVKVHFTYQLSVNAFVIGTSGETGLEVQFRCPPKPDNG